METDINPLKTSVSEGKSLIAAAVTDKGVETAADDTFQIMADNIGEIETGVPVNGATVRMKAHGPIHRGDFVGHLANPVHVISSSRIAKILYMYETNSIISVIYVEGTTVYYSIYRKQKTTLDVITYRETLVKITSGNILVTFIQNSRILITTKSRVYDVRINIDGIPSIHGSEALQHSITSPALQSCVYNNGMLIVCVDYSSTGESTTIYRFDVTSSSIIKRAEYSVQDVNDLLKNVYGAVLVRAYPITENSIIVCSVYNPTNTRETYVSATLLHLTDNSYTITSKIQYRISNNVPPADSDNPTKYHLSDTENRVIYDFSQNTVTLLFYNTRITASSHTVMGTVKIRVDDSNITVLSEDTSICASEKLKIGDWSQWSSGADRLSDCSPGIYMYMQDGRIWVAQPYISGIQEYQIIDGVLKMTTNMPIYKATEYANIKTYMSIKSEKFATPFPTAKNDGQSFSMYFMYYYGSTAQNNQFGIMMNWIVNDAYVTPIGIAVSDLGDTFGEIDVCIYDDNTLNKPFV